MNRKVKNASQITFNNIHFKSKLELFCYQKAKEFGFDIKYEETTFVLLQGFEPKNIKIITPIKAKNTLKYELKLNKSKIRDISYTPDFIISTDKFFAIIETKGMPNDAYPLKKKMFLKYLTSLSEKLNKQIFFIEPHNQTQVIDGLNILQQWQTNQ